MPESSSDPEIIKSFAMTIAELISKKTTDCLQKIILEQMKDEPHDIMDCISAFDENIEKARLWEIDQHNRFCMKFEYVDKLDKDGKSYKERITITPLTNPEREWFCSHTETNFSLDDYTVSKVLADTLLDETKLVVTHKNNLLGKGELLFKHDKKLYIEDILNFFIRNSKHRKHFNLSEDFKPAKVMQKNYGEFYSKIEKRAFDIANSFNKKSLRRKYN
jgi:hypothetical protein